MSRAAVFVEEWSPTYGSPYLVAGDEVPGVEVALAEDGDEMRFHRGGPPALENGQSLAFVDGVRRGEASLYLRRADGVILRGVAGAHACGAVVCRAGARAEFTEPELRRLVIWGGGEVVPLPSGRGGFRWEPYAVASEDPDHPALDLQGRMRRAEGELAEALARVGHLVVVDGSLHYVRSRDLPVVGYVKTHHRPLLEPHHHTRVADLGAGERTSLFALGRDRYSCYLRLAAPRRVAGPWSGIVRLEMPQGAGLAAARAVAHRMAGLLPRYAGVPHRDPRAPQNLQPVGALETRLRHLLGDAGLAARAVRESVLSTQLQGAA